MSETILSRFTPSLLSPEALEALLVQRHDLADRIVAGIRESATTGNKHYYLVIGPRGIGKTHLISLIFHRIDKAADLKDRLLIAWLREEEWGVASYFHLLRVILRALVERYNAGLKSQYDDLMAMADAEAAEPVAERMLLDFIGDKTLLILGENFDEVFRGLETEGQLKLRGLIQNHPVFTIVGAAPSLFNGVELRTEPFYGFFDTNHLHELTYADAVEMVANIARREGNQELEQALRSPLGRARMRAVHHLAGGNPRVYVIFAQFVTTETLRSLVDPFLKTLDDLTPYYQSRMAHLAPQQRQIIEFLCDARGGRTVKEITRSCFISREQTTASQLSKLNEMGYVRSEQRGRESYYELREPLLRLTLDVKKARGGPLPFVIEFLRIWMSPDEISRRMAVVAEQALDRIYLSAALADSGKSYHTDLSALCEQEYTRSIESGDQLGALQTSEELVLLRGEARDRLRHASACFETGDTRSAITECTVVIDSVGIRPTQKAQVLILRGIYEEAMPDLAGAIADFTTVINMPDASTEQRAKALVHRGRCNGAAGDAIGAIADCTVAIDMPDAPAEQRAKALINRGEIKEKVGEAAAAVADYTAVINMPDAPAESQGFAYILRGLQKLKMADAASALTDFTTVIETPDTPTSEKQISMLLRGICRTAVGDHHGAIVDFAAFGDPAETIPELRAAMVLARASSRIETGDSSGALLDWAAVLESSFMKEFENVHQLANAARGWAQAHLGLIEDSLLSFEVGITMAGEARSFDLESGRASVLIALSRDGDARKALEEVVLLLKSRNGEDGGQVAVVRSLLLRSKSPAEWRRVIPFYIEAFARHEMLVSLGNGLAASIRTLRNADVTAQIARQWLEVWRELARGYKEMDLPLRLLDAAVRYLETKDDRPLLMLPVEERKIVEPLLGLKLE